MNEQFYFIYGSNRRNLNAETNSWPSIPAISQQKFYD